MSVVPRLLLGAALAALLPGVGLAQEGRPVRSLLEARHNNVVIQEWDSSCGAAALATLLRFQLGDPVAERTVALGMLRGTDADRVRAQGGFSLLDLKRFAESRGFAADGYADLSAAQLLRIAPAIVPIRSHGGDHFVVFRGVFRGEAVLADPAFGNRSMPFAEFASRWKGRMGFAVTRKTGKNANRLLATRRDVLRVEDESARAALDEKLPKPLTDAQMAFAVVAAETVMSPDSAALAGTPALGPRAGATVQRVAAGSSAPVTTAAATTPTATSPGTPVPTPISTPIASPIATIPTTPISTSPITSPTISVAVPSVPLPPLGITVVAPSLPPLGR